MEKNKINNEPSRSRADELEERLIDFTVRIVKLSSCLPKTPAGKHTAGQILRSGTSPAPNYGEAFKKTTSYAESLLRPSQLPAKESNDQIKNVK